MSTLVAAVAAGVVAGALASALMDEFQRVAAPAFHLGSGGGEPSTEKVADDVSRAVDGRPVPQRVKERAGTMVHYATGIGAGVAYAAIASQWPGVTIGFGIVWGLFLSLALDNLVVPALGLSVWAWQARLGANLFGITSHMVFGAVLEAGRRAALWLVG